MFVHIISQGVGEIYYCEYVCLRILHIKASAESSKKIFAKASATPAEVAKILFLWLSSALQSYLGFGLQCYLGSTFKVTCSVHQRYLDFTIQRFQDVW